MSWQSISFLTDASHAEPLCDALLEAGALSASIEDADAGTPDEKPQFGEPGSVNSPGWTHSRVVALLEIRKIIDQPRALLRNLYAHAFVAFQRQRIANQIVMMTSIKRQRIS